MQVTAVEVSILQSDQDTGRASGHVIFHAQQNGASDIVHFHCNANYAPENGETDLCRALAAEAKRQMLRMPEYRAGEHELVFLEGCEPLLAR